MLAIVPHGKAAPNNLPLYHPLFSLKLFYMLIRSVASNDSIIYFLGLQCSKPIHIS